MTDDQLSDLLFDADRIAVTDLYPARCRTVIANLAAALRERDERMDRFVALAASMDADFEAAFEAEMQKPPGVEVRFTWAESDQEFWLQMTLPDGKSAGINLGNPKTMIATACLRALVGQTP